MTIGGATYDVFIQPTQPIPDEFYHEGAKLEVDTLRTAVGGGATNSAVSFKRLCFEVASYFSYGNDEAGKFIVDFLKQEGIDITHAYAHTEGSTGISHIIPLDSGDRTIFAFRGANFFLKLEKLFDANLASYDAFYITSLSGQAAEFLPHFCAQLRKNRTLIANNPGASQLRYGASALRQALSYIDILILNKHEAQQFMASMIKNEEIIPPWPSTINQQLINNKKLPSLLKTVEIYKNYPFNLPYFFSHLFTCGPRIIVVTNGAEGVYVATPSMIYFHPSISNPVINTLGAGDAFGSAFVGSLLRGASIEDATLYASINSASVIKFLDAKTGLLTLQDLERTAARYQKSLLQWYTYESLGPPTSPLTCLQG